MNVNSYCYYNNFRVTVRFSGGAEQVCIIERATAAEVEMKSEKGFKLTFKRKTGECISGHDVQLCDLDMIERDITVADASGANKGKENALNAIERERKRLQYWEDEIKKCDIALRNLRVPLKTKELTLSPGILAQLNEE